MPLLDGPRLAARLVSEGSRIAWADLVSPRDGVPRSVRDLDVPWIESVLLDVSHSNVRIRDAVRIDGSSGTTQRHRFSIAYSPEATGETLPAHVFIKMNPSGFSERVFGNVFELGATELHMYLELGQTLPVRAPRCFGALLGRAGRFAIILEDLSVTRAVFPTIIDPISSEQAENVVRTLAMLHAEFWGPAVAERFSWLRTPERTRNAAVERAICAVAHRPTLRRFGDVLPERVKRGASAIHAYRPLLERYWADAPRTLIHGDSHVGNMFFLDDEVGLLDWQVAQHHQGIRDVAYFAILSLTIAQRREHERELVALYRDHLLERGVPPEDVQLDALWERYRSFSLYAYIATSVTATLSTLQPPPIARQGLERAAVAVDDLDALSLLDRIVG